jgi:hypothetical protein
MKTPLLDRLSAAKHSANPYARHIKPTYPIKPLWVILAEEKRLPAKELKR